MIEITPADVQTAAGKDYQSQILPLFKKSCFGCHSQTLDEGDLDLQTLLADRPLVKNRQKWINVYEQIRNHAMPPADEPPPSDEDRRTVVAWIHHQVHNFDYSKTDNPGYEPVRRLTHLEYSNTIRDLLDLEVDVLSKFPADLSASSGFDNSANSLFVQPLLMEKYFQIAEFIVDKVKTRQKTEPSKDSPFFHHLPNQSLLPEKAIEQNLDTFLPRAFRRKVTAEETRQFRQIFVKAFGKSGDFVDASGKVLQAILVSPNFLFRLESSPKSGKTFPVSNYEMANRLSYFLWASMPDDELLESARNGNLLSEDGVKQELNRMLADPKSRSIGTVFGSQWLGYQHLGTRIRADPIDNPWCTDSLMEAMKQESSLLLHSLVLENRPIAELLRSKDTFVNEELARFYGIKGVRGKQMRKVKSAKGREGVLGHAGILAVTSHPYQTSPVKRGTWILTELLGSPPPPPPPGASEFAENIQENDRLSFRQKLARHSKDSRCVSCHRQIDPLGFGLEKFDWFGRQRRRRVDDSGQLPDGTKFRGLIELNQTLVDKKLDDVARNFVQRLLSYGLSRQLEYFDEKTVNLILSKTKSNGYPLQDIVVQVATSYPFRYKKN